MLSRRTMLRATVVAGASLALANGTARARPNGKTAVVIGSGFGGAVAAQRLGEAGYTVTVLERGQRWNIDPAGNTFPTINEPDRRSGWFADRPPVNPLTQFVPIPRYAGVIDLVKGEGLEAAYGSCVGGGSVIFGSYIVQPRRSDFEYFFPRDISYADLDSVYFPRARAGIGASPLPSDLLEHPRYHACRAWLEDIADFGGTPTFHDFAVDWDIVREELAGRRQPSIIVGEGSYGVNSGAKNTLDHSYLARAENTGNVTVAPLHEVVGIAEDGPKFTVTAKRMDEFGTVLEHKNFTADYLFMAAGSFYTPALLLAARAGRTMNRLNEHVGKGFGTNGDFLIGRSNNRRNYGFRNAGPGVAVMYTDTPDGPVSMSWQAAPLPEYALGNNTTHLIQVPTRERGSVDWNPATARAELTYPHGEETSDVDVRGRAFAAQFKQQADDRHGFPLNGIPITSRISGFGAKSTFHGLGGMVAGQATDFDGKVKGYNNLYIVDGSFVPGGVGLVNPALTITALAERTMDRFLGSH